MEINTCNVFYCDGFTQNSKNKPSIWTQNWNGWFFAFVGAIPYETVVISFFHPFIVYYNDLATV